ncbi:glycosyltransferase [Acholeplasma manati]|uniref:Glycosyltransferase n=1 Tax=Paracholeplasma manati TaxID=591373 RepID=A0ABT2Y431_9MOLU|nr:glycosyltransferase [Paracholeplasma manati]MCV2231496.1 glycosyltransferase [Paracholeplasma manati]
MTKILFIIPKLNGGGAEKVVSNLSHDLSMHYDVHIAVFDNSDQTYDCTGTIHDLKIPAQKKYFNKILNIYKRYKKIKTIKKNHDFVASISFLDGPHLINAMTRRREKIIVSIRNNISMENKSFLRLLILKYIFKVANKIVAISSDVKNDIINLKLSKSDKIDVIYNSVNSNLIRKLADTEINFNFEPNAHYLINVGRLTFQKGQWNLIQVFSELIKIKSNVYLLIAGTGELKEKLVNYCEYLGIQDKVIFLGYVSNPYPFIRKSDIFTFSSNFEGLGNSILESLALSTTVISTDCKSGPREILDPGNNEILLDYKIAKYGILTPIMESSFDFLNQELSKSQKIYLEAILKVLSEKEIQDYYKKNSEIRISDFSPEKIANEWIKIINK